MGLCATVPNPGVVSWPMRLVGLQAQPARHLRTVKVVPPRLCTDGSCAFPKLAYRQLRQKNLCLCRLSQNACGAGAVAVVQAADGLLSGESGEYEFGAMPRISRDSETSLADAVFVDKRGEQWAFPLSDSWRQHSPHVAGDRTRSFLHPVDAKLGLSVDLKIKFGLASWSKLNDARVSRPRGD